MNAIGKEVFVPFLGDFLSILNILNNISALKARVFVPFLGDFLSISSYFIVST